MPLLPGPAEKCGMCGTRAGKTRHSPASRVPRAVTSRRAGAMRGAGVTGAGAALLSPLSGVWSCRTPSWRVLPVPPQAGQVTNTSWSAACLPGAGASFWKADSPQHLPPLPPRLPDKNFPFSHCFNCPHLRKLLRKKKNKNLAVGRRDRAAPAGHSHSGGDGMGWDGMMGWDTRPAAHLGDTSASIWGTQGMSQ